MGAAPRPGRAGRSIDLSRSLRIGLYENLPPGGAKRSAYEFGRYLARRHVVELYTLRPATTEGFDLAPEAARVYRYRYSPLFGLLDRRLDHGRYAPRSFTLFEPLRRLHRRIARDMLSRNYDVVLAHTDAMTQAPYLLRWTGRRGVYYCHEVLRVAREAAIRAAHRAELRRSRQPVGSFRVLEDAYVMRRWVSSDRATARAAGRILVNSGYTREQVWAAYAKPADVTYPGVDVEHFHPGAATSRRREVLSIGSPIAIKGHELIIRALGRINPSVGRPGLRIVAASLEGAGDLRALSLAQGVEIEMEGPISEQALVSRYQGAAATVCAARLEPFGLTPLESMACATPVIAIREAGFRESIVDRQTGLLVEPEEDALAGAIEELVNNEQLARELGAHGRDHVVEQWTWERRGKELESALQESISEWN